MKNPKKPAKTAAQPQVTAKAPEAAKRPEPTQDQIRARAHEIYLKRGGTQGHEIDDWVAAERELRGR